MVCNPTSCANRSRRHGFTLIESMFAMGVGLLVITAALVLWAYASRTCAALFSYVELSTTSKNALDRISQQVRNASRVESCSAERLVVIVPADVGTGTVKVTYLYSPTNQTLTQTTLSGNQKETMTLLTECTNFQFSIYQRTPQYQTSQLITNAWNTNTAKVVEMRWVCARQLTGDKNIIETQVSAKAVMRNK